MQRWEINVRRPVARCSFIHFISCKHTDESGFMFFETGQYELSVSRFERVQLVLWCLSHCLDALCLAVIYSFEATAPVLCNDRLQWRLPFDRLM